jgi:hypothetical protein
MAHAFSITDGTTTINLNQASGYIVKTYDMNTVDSSKDELEDEPEITETLDIMVLSTTTAALQALVHPVELMLVAARRRQKYQVGPRIYLQLQIDAEANTWRAEIKDGRFKPDKDTLDSWYSKKVPYHLIVTHRVWEGPETELQLSTLTQSAATGGRTIQNHDNNGGSFCNWVQIAAAQVNGVLPTPVKLVLTNTSGVSMAYRNFYMATNAFSNPANLVCVVEGENRISAGTVTSDATDSGGAYDNYTFTNTGEIKWTLSSIVTQRTQGRMFRILMRMHGWSGTNLYVKPVIKDSAGLLPLYTGDEVLMGSSGSQFIDLGAIPIPPGGYQTAWGSVVLSLVMRCTGAGIFNIDFMQLTPLDAYQYIVQSGFSVVNNDTVTFDNIENIMSTTDGPIFSPHSGPLKVFPGVVNKIHFLQDEGSSSNISRTFSVRAYIRERRLTV